MLEAFTVSRCRQAKVEKGAGPSPSLDTAKAVRIGRRIRSRHAVVSARADSSIVEPRDGKGGTIDKRRWPTTRHTRSTVKNLRAEDSRV